MGTSVLIGPLLLGLIMPASGHSEGQSPLKGYSPQSQQSRALRLAAAFQPLFRVDHENRRKAGRPRLADVVRCTLRRRDYKALPANQACILLFCLTSASSSTYHTTNPCVPRCRFPPMDHDNSFCTGMLSISFLVRV
jgi:hypothetical protein